MIKTDRKKPIYYIFCVGCVIFLTASAAVWAARSSRSGTTTRSSSSRGSVRNAERSTASRSTSSGTRSSSSQTRSTSQQSASRSTSTQTSATRTTTTDSVRTTQTRPVNEGNRNVHVDQSTNVNVNVDANRYHGGGHHSHHGDHWKYREDARRDWMRFRTVNNLIRAGTYWATRPKSSTTVVVSSKTYYYWGGMYYVSSGSGYVVVAPPPTAVVYAIPVSATPVYVSGATYYYYGGTYYVPTTKPAEAPKEIEEKITVDVGANGTDGELKSESMEAPEMTPADDKTNYEVVKPPVGAAVPYLPDEAKEKTIDGKKYFVHEDTYYRAFAGDDETIYMVVEDPTAKKESK